MAHARKDTQGNGERVFGVLLAATWMSSGELRARNWISVPSFQRGFRTTRAFRTASGQQKRRLSLMSLNQMTFGRLFDVQCSSVYSVNIIRNIIQCL